MEESLQNILIFTITPQEAILNLVLALLCGVIIAAFYRATYKGVSFSTSNVISLLMLTMITTLVIMVIGNNLARAFGLVGAMSIIRFRTAVKHTQDIMYIFFALAAGLACGAGMYFIALLGTVIIGFTMLIADLIYAENPLKKEFLLQIEYEGDDENNRSFSSAMGKYCSKNKLINVKTISENSNLLELSFYVVMKSNNQASQLVNELKGETGVKKVNLFFDEN